jgi:hypothetical protein
LAAHGSLALGSEALDGSLRSFIATVGLQLYSDSAEILEGMAQQEELALGVDRGALPARADPRPADLEATVRALDVEKTHRAGDLGRPARDDRERDVETVTRAFDGLCDHLACIVDRLERRSRHEFPDARVAAGSEESVGMLHRQRLDADVLSLERDGLRIEVHVHTSQTLTEWRSAFA